MRGEERDRIGRLREYIAQEMKRCRLCPRQCGADRAGGQTGLCGAADRLIAARAALHMWEEPCLSGPEGSGTVFFSGCGLGCIYCQNHEISGMDARQASPAATAGQRRRAEREKRRAAGQEISEERLAEIFLELQSQEANNINLVTAGHFIPQVGIALLLAREKGLSIPVVYNSSGYERAESLRLLEGLVDIWLPDWKYLDRESAGAYSRAPDYPDIAGAALEEMVRQSPELCYDERGMLRRGVIVRHMLLPGHVKEAKQITAYLHETYGERILISLLGQYTPMPAMRSDPLLGRRVTAREYSRLLDYAVSIGVESGFFQEGGAAMESFVPEFDGRGIKRA